MISHLLSFCGPGHRLGRLLISVSEKVGRTMQPGIRVRQILPSPGRSKACPPLLLEEKIREAARLANAGELDRAQGLYTSLLEARSPREEIPADLGLLARSAVRRILVPAALGKALVAEEAQQVGQPFITLIDHLPLLSEVFGCALPNCFGLPLIDPPWGDRLTAAAEAAQEGNPEWARIQYCEGLDLLDAVLRQTSDPAVRSLLAGTTALVRATCWLGAVLTLPATQVGSGLMLAAPALGDLFGQDVIPFARRAQPVAVSEGHLGKLLRFSRS